jgi:hypothetical protein
VTKTLMLVSQWAGSQLRADVAAGLRPCPEFLRLEAEHGVELLDWSRLPGRISQRTPLTALTRNQPHSPTLAPPGRGG